MRSRGTATDVARAFSIVKQRSDELLRLDIGELDEAGVRTPNITFQPRQQYHQSQHQELPSDGEAVNVVGQLVVNEEWNKAVPTACQLGSIAVEAWSLIDDNDDDDDGDETGTTGEGK